MKHLKTINFYLLIFGMLATVGAISYLSHTWELTFSEWLGYSFHYIWAVLPLLLLLWLNAKKNPTSRQSVVIFAFILLELILAIVGYSLAISAGLHPKVSVLLTMLPLYQLIMSILVFPLYSMGGKV
jgi:glucan phosphoethanolaminetransferase (alkaline phosphatase superfamily)